VNQEEYPSAVDAATKVTEVWCQALVRERVMAWMDAHSQDRRARTTVQIWSSYGRRYAMLFEGAHRSAAPRSRRTDSYGLRALAYLLRARDFESLSRFVGILIDGASDPRVLDAVVAELRTAAQELPAGEPPWLLQIYMADALRGMGRSDDALPLYERVAAETEHAEDWGMMSWCCCNWATALRETGQLHAAQVTYVRSAEASSKAGRPSVDVMAIELEALRVEVEHGHAEKALPEIEARLQRIRGWWTAHRAGQNVPEAPDALALGKAMMSSLDVAEEANAARERWKECLDLNDERERVGKALGESEHDLAHTRMSRLGPLLGLGRVEEAQTVLEGCVDQLRKAGDAPSEAQVLSALAELWLQRGDLQHATSIQRQALAVLDRLPDPNGRAVAHNNLAAMLEASNQADAAATHRLVAFAYAIVSEHAEHAPAWMRNLALAKQESSAEGLRYALPRVTDVLGLAGFHALRRFLDAAAVDLERLQAAIDEIEARVDQEALGQKLVRQGEQRVVSKLPSEPAKMLSEKDEGAYLENAATPEKQGTEGSMLEVASAGGSKTQAPIDPPLQQSGLAARDEATSSRASIRTTRAASYELVRERSVMEARPKARDGSRARRFAVAVSLLATVVAVIAVTITITELSQPPFYPLTKRWQLSPKPPPARNSQPLPIEGFQELTGTRIMDSGAGGRAIEPRTFNKGDELRIQIGGPATCVVVQFVEQGGDPKEPKFFIEKDVPSHGVVHVITDQEHNDISQVFVRGGHVWGQLCSASNGEAMIKSLMVKPSALR